jgi:hypothetical protein
VKKKKKKKKSKQAMAQALLGKQVEAITVQV